MQGYTIPSKARAVGRHSRTLKLSFLDNNFEASMGNWGGGDILKHWKEAQSQMTTDYRS